MVGGFFISIRDPPLFMHTPMQRIAQTHVEKIYRKSDARVVKWGCRITGNIYKIL